MAALRSVQAALADVVVRGVWGLGHLCRGGTRKNPPGSVGAVLRRSQGDLVGCGHHTGWSWSFLSYQCPSLCPCQRWHLSDPGLSLFMDLNWQKTLLFLCGRKLFALKYLHVQAGVRWVPTKGSSRSGSSSPLETRPMEVVSLEGLSDRWLTKEGAALVKNLAVLQGARH